jgi:hypothetical protein
MKKHLIILLFAFLFSLFSVHCFGQWPPILVDKIFTFDTDTPKVVIDTANHQNIWQIGRPKKVFFDSAYSKPNAIITDTVNDYLSDNLSCFTIEVKKKGEQDFPCWGTAKLSFFHKYDTDTLYDGGYIEIQYDTSTTWTNIIFGSVTDFNQNLYSKTDTILGNIPAFNGKSNRWIYSEFNWFWSGMTKSRGPRNDVKIRFVFQSSSKKVNREGWLIDNIRFTIYQCVGGVNESGIKNKELGIKVYPNPVNQFAIINYQLSIKSNVSIKVFDVTGREVEIIENGEKRIENEGMHTINFNAGLLQSGVYFVKLVTDEGFGVTKFVKY